MWRVAFRAFAYAAQADLPLKTRETNHRNEKKKNGKKKEKDTVPQHPHHSSSLTREEKKKRRGRRKRQHSFRDDIIHRHYDVIGSPLTLLAMLRGDRLSKLLHESLFFRLVPRGTIAQK